MKIAIVGSRNFNDYPLLVNILNLFCLPDEIISGGAKGADTLADNYAENNGIKFTVFKADWNKYGKSAGFIRNRLIVNAADMVIAFWDGESRGTKDTIDKAIALKKLILIVRF